MLNRMQQTISYSDQNVDLEAYVAAPASSKCPLVLLCHAWRGRDDFICEKAQLIAQLGYVGFALDMYGKDVLGKTKEENAALKKPFVGDRALLRRRLLKGYEAASALPGVDTSRMVALGFGFGGLCALELAWSGVNLQGAISIYGHFDRLPLHPIKTKILLLHGYKDPVTPLHELNTFQQEMSQFQIDWETHLYGKACHAFATPSAQDPAAGILYDPASAERAWKAAESFIEEVLSKEN